MSLAYTRAVWAAEVPGTALPDGRRLGPQHLLVLLYLADCVNRRSLTGECWPSARTIAAATGHTVKRGRDPGRVRYLLADLEAAELIEREARPGKKSVIRLLVDPATAAMDPARERAGTPRADEGGTDVHPARERAAPRALTRGDPARGRADITDKGTGERTPAAMRAEEAAAANGSGPGEPLKLWHGDEHLPEAVAGIAACRQARSHPVIVVNGFADIDPDEDW